MEWLCLLQEGSSQARYFVSRLIPAHKDPPYEQVLCAASNFPLLGWYVSLDCDSDCGLRCRKQDFLSLEL